MRDITGIPLFHLDMLHWNADRTTVEKAVFLERLSQIVQEDEWIIDGNYNATIELRLQHCDTVIFLDYPLETCLSGVRERKGKPRPDMPWIEPEGEDDPEFIDFINSYNVQSRPYVMAVLSQYCHKKIYIFQNRQSVDAFLQALQ